MKCPQAIHFYNESPTLLSPHQPYFKTKGRVVESLLFSTVYIFEMGFIKSTLLATVTVFVGLCGINRFFTLPKCIRYHFRYFACHTFLAISSAYGVIASVVARLCGYPVMGQYLTAKAYYGLASTILDFRFKIENEEILRKHKSAVLVVNHQS